MRTKAWSVTSFAVSVVLAASIPALAFADDLAAARMTDSNAGDVIVDDGARASNADGPAVHGTPFALAAQQAGVDDYPARYKEAPKDSLIDEWRFYNRECVSFVAWRLCNDNGIDFSNFYGGVQWGNGGEWGHAARALGIDVDMNPAPGSVAWWDNGGYGHVAWVRSVDGELVTIEEYNYANTGTYHERTVPRASVSGFIHIADLPEGYFEHEPEGCLDEAVGGKGKVSVKGWALDVDDDETPLQVHVYLIDEEGNTECNSWVIADQAREDVKSAFGVEGDHGFNVTFQTRLRGSVHVYAYAINPDEGENPLLNGDRDVFVEEIDPVSPGGVSEVPMSRLYNPYSGEHFYTSSETERDDLTDAGWIYEDVGWYAPSLSWTPVYRLYNPFAGDHHYTVDDAEKDYLESVGWNFEGIGWFSDDYMGVALFRQYNPNAVAGSHNYTSDDAERDNLVGLGWHDEGVAWYGMER